jgi:hypothetical protein
MRVDEQAGRHQRNEWKGDDPGASQCLEAAAKRRARAVEQAHQRDRDEGVGEQVGQVPQVIPSDAQLPAGEGAFRPGLQRQVLAQEGEVARFRRPVAQGLEVGLRRNDDRHAEQQRDAEPEQALARQLPVAGPPPEEIEGQAGHQEHQLHAPLVGQGHRQF